MQGALEIEIKDANNMHYFDFISACNSLDPLEIISI
jgi:hypothetical protein